MNNKVWENNGDNEILSFVRTVRFARSLRKETFDVYLIERVNWIPAKSQWLSMSFSSDIFRTENVPWQVDKRQLIVNAVNEDDYSRNVF